MTSNPNLEAAKAAFDKAAAHSPEIRAIRPIIRAGNVEEGVRQLRAIAATKTGQEQSDILAAAAATEKLAPPTPASTPSQTTIASARPTTTAARLPVAREASAAPTAVVPTTGAAASPVATQKGKSKFSLRRGGGGLPSGPKPQGGKSNRPLILFMVAIVALIFAVVVYPRMTGQTIRDTLPLTGIEQAPPPPAAPTTADNVGPGVAAYLTPVMYALYLIAFAGWLQLLVDIWQQLNDLLPDQRKSVKAKYYAPAMMTIGLLLVYLTIGKLSDMPEQGGGAYSMLRLFLWIFYLLMAMFTWYVANRDTSFIAFQFAATGAILVVFNPEWLKAFLIMFDVQMNEVIVLNLRGMIRAISTKTVSAVLFSFITYGFLLTGWIIYALSILGITNKVRKPSNLASGLAVGLSILYPFLLRKFGLLAFVAAVALSYLFLFIRGDEEADEAVALSLWGTFLFVLAISPTIY